MIYDRKFRDDEIICVFRSSTDGVTGTGIIDEANELLTVIYKTMIFEKYLVVNGGNKKGFLKSARKLSDEAMENLRKAWSKLYSNNGNNMMLLNDGIDFKESSNTSVEMQLNENKKANNDYVCEIFNLSPSVVAGMATDESYTTAIKTAVMPVIRAFETALNQGLLLESERHKHYFAFDTTELLKGDILKRYQAYQIGLANNFLQADEVRYKEDLKPLGFNFIRLGLQDVLLDPKTNTIYTPNTNQTTMFGQSSKSNIPTEETRADNNFIQDPKTGRMQGSRPQGGSSKSGSGKSEKKSDKKDSKDVEKSAESGIIKEKKITNAVGHPVKIVKRNEIYGESNGITQKENSKGGIERNYYDGNGNQIKQVSNNDHGNPKKHPYGKNGEHTHDYIYDENGNLIGRPMRELTDEERKENEDIL